jgi:hypothetical protein
MVVPVELKTAEGDLLAESRNISNDGMLLRSPVPLSIGSRVQMAFSVPRQNNSDDIVRLYCGGRVVRLESMEGGFGIAIAWHGASVCAG